MRGQHSQEVTGHSAILIHCVSSAQEERQAHIIYAFTHITELTNKELWVGRNQEVALGAEILATC